MYAALDFTLFDLPCWSSCRARASPEENAELPGANPSARLWHAPDCAPFIAYLYVCGYPPFARLWRCAVTAELESAPFRPILWPSSRSMCLVPCYQDDCARRAAEMGGSGSSACVADVAVITATAAAVTCLSRESEVGCVV